MPSLAWRLVVVRAPCHTTRMRMLRWVLCAVSAVSWAACTGQTGEDGDRQPCTCEDTAGAEHYVSSGVVPLACGALSEAEAACVEARASAASRDLHAR